MELKCREFISAKEITKSTRATRYSYDLLETNVHNSAAMYFDGMPSYAILCTSRNKATALNTATRLEMQEHKKPISKTREWNILICLVA